MGPIRTLLVEADAGRGASLCAQLAADGAAEFAVEESRTLHSAVERASAGRLDVVVLDLDLPDAQGEASVLRLRGAAPSLPIVELTGADDDEQVLRALRASAQECLVKSRVDALALRTTIRRALARQCSQAEEFASDAHELRAALGASVHGLVLLSEEGLVVFANAAAAKLLGRPLAGAAGAVVGFPITPGARHELGLCGGRVIESQAVACTWRGAPAWAVSLSDVTHHEHTRTLLAGAAANTRIDNAHLRQLSRIDPLTELLNRRGLAEVLSNALTSRRRSGAPLAAVLLDCDDFKDVNAVQGHAGGDVVLKELARRLQQSLRPADHVGRIGGDEFLVLLPATRFAEALEVAERLRLCLSHPPLRLGARTLQISASLGVEIASDDCATIEDLLVQTQDALERSKQAGKNRVSAHGGVAADCERILRELQAGSFAGVARRAIVRLADETVVGCELTALGPPGAFEAPRDYNRLALEHGVHAQVDMQSLLVCVDGSRDLPAELRRHVKLSPSTLLDTEPERLQAACRRASPDASFCFEFSDQHFVGDPWRMRAKVLALKERGLWIAIDDVGYGQSSLEALLALEPDLIKLDASFVRESAGDPVKRRALQRMIQIAAALDCSLVAKGIDSRACLEALSELGVRYGQGAVWGGSRPALLLGVPSRATQLAARDCLEPPIEASDPRA